MGPLLDREGEVEIAQRIEQGEWLIYEALCEDPLVLRELLRLNELAQKDKRVLRELVSGNDPDEPLDPKAADRIKRNLKIFDQIAKLDTEIAKLRRQQAKYKAGGARYQEFARDIDGVVGKIAQEIRSIDFSLQTRNRLVDYLKNLDRQFSALEQEVIRAYDVFEFHVVYQKISQFVAVELSAIYHDVAKDRLYTDPADSLRRRSTQTALHRIFSALALLLTPLLAFTAERFLWTHKGVYG